MAITGNKGEWSEVYTCLRLLADGKLFAADEQLNRIHDMFFPIIKIIREETKGTPYEYYPNKESAEVAIFLNETQILKLPATIFNSEADHLFKEIAAQGSGHGAFSVEKTESFIRKIHINKLKAISTDKADINIQLHDINTGYERVVGFSIKSELGMPPTLLNAGKTTNFTYIVENLDKKLISRINSIDSHRKIKDRINAIITNGGRLIFDSMDNEIFRTNLTMIDSQMPIIVAHMLIGYYQEDKSSCLGLSEYISKKNPLSRSKVFYTHKIKEMLSAVALGMKPATEWDGTEEASGGYIIVKTNGDVLAYHIYNRDAFRKYLLYNTKLESAGSDRHSYGTLYEEDNTVRIKLNLQIRFK